MRVVHVATAFPRSADDVVTPWLVRLLGELHGRGVEAETFAPAYRGLGSGEVEGIPVHRFRYAPAPLERLTHDLSVPDRLSSAPWFGALLPPYLAAGTLAAARLGRTRPDVVHVHWPVPHALFGAAARAASGGHAALVCSFYSVELAWVERRLPWLRPFLRWSVRTADAVTAISTPTAAAVRKVAERPVRVIPFAAAVDREAGAEPRPPFGGDPARPLRLLFVGRLVERKGVEVLVRALPRILEERDAVVDVVGDGPRAAEIRRAAEACGVADRVRLAGYVPEEELRRRYASCDVFVLPAVVDARGDTEGLGVVLLEALRYARPVVASGVGGIPDIVVPGRSGMLVPSGEPGALAEAVLDLARHPEEARRLGERGRVWAEERFAWSRIVDDLLACYGEAIATRRGAAR